jgi:putative FmdB family regulatory protein
MPVYKYKCERCGHRRGVFHKMNESPKMVCDMPNCKSRMVRTVARTSFSLQGKRWFRDGYGG